MNPYTSMRRNVESALENHAGLRALGVVLRKWDSEGAQRVDNPAADRKRWLRVETTSLTFNPFWTNGYAQSTQDLRIAAVLPIQAGKKQEDIEELWYQIQRALAGLTRDVMETPVAQFQSFTLTGGSVALDESGIPEKKEAAANLVWSQIGSMKIVYDESIADLRST